jgi:hypothetical protein
VAEFLEIVYHPHSGQMCWSNDGYAASPEWTRLLGGEHGRVVMCEPHRELGIQPRPGIEHLRAVLPENVTVAESGDGRVTVTLNAH